MIVKPVSDLAGPAVDKMTLLEQDVAKTVAEIKAKEKPKAYTGFLIRFRYSEHRLDYIFHYLNMDCQWIFEEVSGDSMCDIVSKVDVLYPDSISLPPNESIEYTFVELSTKLWGLKGDHSTEFLRYLKAHGILNANFIETKSTELRKE